MNTTLIHDIPAERLQILDARFYSNNNIDFYPGSTTILSAYPHGSWYRPWVESVGGQTEADKIMESAGTEGSNVHAASEAIDEGKDVYWVDPNAPESKPYYNLDEWMSILNYLDFKNKVQPQIFSTETVLCSDNLRIGGTLDRVVDLGDGIKRVLDIKTSNNLSPTFPFQIASYAFLWNEIQPPEWQVEGACVLWLKSTTRTDKIDPKKGIWQGRYEGCTKNWQIILYDDIKKGFNTFQHIQAVWESANPNFRPLNQTYPDKIIQSK